MAPADPKARAKMTGVISLINGYGYSDAEGMRAWRAAISVDPDFAGTRPNLG